MPRTIKIAHIVTRLELGGAQQNTLYTLRKLDRARFSPILISGSGGMLDGEAAAADCPVHFLPSLGRALHPVADPMALFALARLLARERPDIVHTHSSKAGILGRWAAWWTGVPIVVHTFHGFGFNREQWALPRAAFIWAERFTAHITRSLIAVSEANRDDGLNLGIGRPSQYRLIRSGVSLEAYRGILHTDRAPDHMPISPEQKLITTIGPFKPQKNLGDFLRVAAEVCPRRPDARFLIIGDGAGRAALEKQIRRQKLSQFVILAGWRRDIPAVMARSDVFCMTSLWEGLPRSLVEAMASGVPSVVNAVDGCCDLIQDGVNGFLTPPKRPFATADRILRLLNDPEMAARMGARARAAVGAEFDIDRMVRQQEDLYDSLLPPASSPAEWREV